MKKEDKPKEKLSFVSYKNHIIIFGASHYWIFLTHNTSKLRNSAQNHTHTYIYIYTYKLNPPPNSTCRF